MDAGHWKIGMMLALLGLSGCGDNRSPAGSEQLKAYGTEALNQYQRRAELVPNLVSTVKGYGAQSQEVLTQVNAARGAIGALRVTPELLNNPEALAKVQNAQTQLSGSLSRLATLAQNAAPAKAEGNPRNLAVQPEGSAKRISMASGASLNANARARPGAE